MNFIDNIKERAKNEIKTIILPESMDRRVVEAASKAINEKIANIILIAILQKIICLMVPVTKINVLKELNLMNQILLFEIAYM